MRVKYIKLLISVILIIVLAAGCSSSPLKGEWVSDVNSTVEICFIDDYRMTVKTGDTVFDGVYSIDGNKLEMTLNSPTFSEKVFATYEKVGKNKLLLTNINGETEQFLRK